MQIEDEHRQREELRDQANMAERRSAVLQTEKEDLSLAYEQVSKRSCVSDRHDTSVDIL
jgi:hypothetical protein